MRATNPMLVKKVIIFLALFLLETWAGVHAPLKKRLVILHEVYSYCDDPNEEHDKKDPRLPVIKHPRRHKEKGGNGNC